MHVFNFDGINRLGWLDVGIDIGLLRRMLFCCLEEIVDLFCFEFGPVSFVAPIHYAIHQYQERCQKGASRPGRGGWGLGVMGGGDPRLTEW